MTKITNVNSPYYGKSVKILKKEDDIYEVWIDDGEDGAIVGIPVSDIEISVQIKIPKSRAEFYSMINNESHTLKHICDVINQLIKNKKIVLNSIDQESFMERIHQCDRAMVTGLIRQIRDEGVIDFLLPNR